MPRCGRLWASSGRSRRGASASQAPGPGPEPGERSRVTCDMCRRDSAALRALGFHILGGQALSTTAAPALSLALRLHAARRSERPAHAPCPLQRAPRRARSRDVRGAPARGAHEPAPRRGRRRLDEQPRWHFHSYYGRWHAPHDHVWQAWRRQRHTLRPAGEELRHSVSLDGRHAPAAHCRAVREFACACNALYLTMQCRTEVGRMAEESTGSLHIRPVCPSDLSLIQLLHKAACCLMSLCSRWSHPSSMHCTIRSVRFPSILLCLGSRSTQHWILDGFPRTVGQGEMLDSHLR
jgi:hypothetical protein